VKLLLEKGSRIVGAEGKDEMDDSALQAGYLLKRAE